MAPTIQAPTATISTFINIAYPKFDFIKYGTNFTYHIHAYGPLGVLLTNATTTCVLHLYNVTGDHIIEENMEFDDNLVDFYKIFNTSIIKLKDEYSVLVHCSAVDANQTSYGGFISTSFKVNTLGEDESMQDIWKWPVLGILLIFIIMMFFLMVFTSEEHSYLKLLYLFMGLIGFTALLHIAIKILEYTSANAVNVIAVLNKFYEVWIWIFGFLLFYYVIVYFVFNILMAKMIDRWKQKKQKDDDFEL